MLLNHQMSSTNGARKLALGSEIERQKTEPPLGLNIHGLYHSSAVWTRPWCWLPSQNPLILIAHKHQTHLSFCLLISFGQENSEKYLKFSVKTRLIAVWSIEFFYVVGCRYIYSLGFLGVQNNLAGSGTQIAHLGFWVSRRLDQYSWIFEYEARFWNFLKF